MQKKKEPQFWRNIIRPNIRPNGSESAPKVHDIVLLKLSRFRSVSYLDRRLPALNSSEEKEDVSVINKI